MINTRDEAHRCLLCLQAPCNTACKKNTHPARGLRALRFDDRENAHQWLTQACLDCDAPCEKACIYPDQPIRIRQLARYVDTLPRPEINKPLPSLNIDFCGVKCENPFFLASSAVCTNYDMVARAFDMGWGGVVFKTIGMQPMQEVSPRFDVNDHWHGFRNMEQISENTPEENFRILAKLKQNFPTKVVVASIMGQDDQEWTDLAIRAEQAGADILELNFSCPQMGQAHMGSDVGQDPQLVAYYTLLVKQAVKIPVLAKMTPNITQIAVPATAAYLAGADGIAAINTIKSITLTKKAMVNGARTISGYSGAAIKPIALRHILDMTTNMMLSHSSRPFEFSGIGGIATWRDALDFIVLGCRNVQICTAVMEFGYRIIEDLTLGLQTYMASHGVEHLSELVGSKKDSFVQPSHLDRDTIVFPKFNHQQCIGCGRCYIACEDAGHQAIIWDESKRQPKLNGTKCVGCHLCRLVCPQQAIDTAQRIPKPKR